MTKTVTLSELTIAAAAACTVLGGLAGAGLPTAQAQHRAVAAAPADPADPTDRADGGYRPGATLVEDIEKLGEVGLVNGYRQRRPRLLFGQEDRSELARRKDQLPPGVWQALIKQAEGLARVPSAEAIRKGSSYTRAEWMLSGALASYLTGNEAYAANAVKWMVAYCQVDHWAPGNNADLGAGWNLYYVSLAYDILHPQIAEADRKVIRDGLVSHARAVYESKKPPQEYRYDQNHTYIPVTGLGTAALALLGEAEEAPEWLRRSSAILRRCCYVQGTDGYYYEGYGYCAYAMHWLVRWADLISRATGQKALAQPLFRRNHLFLQHLSLPGSPYCWDIGDSGKWKGTRPVSQGANIGWKSYLYRLACEFQDGEIQGVADRLARASKEFSDPGMLLLWYDPSVKADRPESLAPYHHFADHDVVCWRSSWQPDATVLMFKCGPPEGHAAAAKAKRLTDWKMNHGHVHPDIGMFWLYAKGQYLAVDTGYTQRKRTSDHNTIVVEGCGQGIDYNYWVYRGLPYEMFDAVRMEKVHLEKAYGYAMGDFGSAYHPPQKAGKLSLRRHALVTKGFLVVFDEMSSDRANAYTWLLHSDGPFAETSGHFETTRNDARLAVYVLAPKDFTPKIGPTVVFRGDEPHQGKDEQVGHQLALETSQKVLNNQFLTVLVPLGKGEPAPTQAELLTLGRDRLELKITWPAGAEQNVSLDLSWKPGSSAGPAAIGATTE